MSRTRSRSLVVIPLLSLLAACNNLSHTLRKDLPVPRTLAVLPFVGDAPAAARELARGLLSARLSEQGYRVVETNYVDGVLTANGWLGDPDVFAARGLPVDQVLERLGVDGVLIADEFDESSFNLYLLRRHAVTGHLRIVGRSTEDWWTARHKVGTTGGLLLQSGQVLTELRAQGMHGNSASTIALIDALLEDIAATLPKNPDSAEPSGPGRPLQVAAAAVQSAAAEAPGDTRLAVSATATPGASVWFDVGDAVLGVPMAGHGERYTGAIDVPAGTTAAMVRVRARDPFGGQRDSEARR